MRIPFNLNVKDEEKYLSKELRNAIEDIKLTRSERKLHGLFRETFPGVYSCGIVVSKIIVGRSCEGVELSKIVGIP